MSAASEWVVVEQTRRVMATRMSVHIAAPPGDAGGANAAIARGMAWLEALSDRLTRFSAESELARLNASAGTWCAVSGVLFAVVAESVIAARATDGLFDPALLPLLEALGYDRDYDEIEHREIGQGNDVSFVAGRWRDIELDATRLRILLPEGTRLDLGGIAKGWAADAALARYFARYDNVLINAGGDMRARGGAKPGEPWAIGIGNPLAPPDAEPAENAAVLAMNRGGIATSGATGRWWNRGGERQHHLLDPRTCRPIPLWVDASDNEQDTSSLIATATALAPTAAHAEVAAKVALLRGYPDALHQVESAWDAERVADAAPYGDEAVALMLILGNGSIVCSANINEFLNTVGGGGDLWLD
ncbi:MAG TPA: FAD:protein FMN transferase [Ktedonobacterales bacterium]|nr:FAD:protein FMN transferase [Ktedonobacterales bacterium]